MSVRTSLLPGSGTIRCSLVENSMVAYSSASLANWEETVVQFLPKYAAFFIRLSTTFGYISIVGSIFRPRPPELDSLKYEIARSTNNQITFLEIHEHITPQG